jgi:molecular chaperone Hsp33
MSSKDGVLHAMTRDLSFRVVCARTTDTVLGAAKSQEVSGKTAGILGELITGAVLIRHAMARNLRVQVILQGADGKSAVVADAHPDGMTRGLVKLAKGATELDLGPGSMLQVMRTLPSGMVQQGVVDVPESGGVSGALMAYMQESEQVVTMIAVTSLVPFVDGHAAGSSGGYLVQPLPEVERGSLEVMTERLSKLESVDDLLAAEDASAGSILEAVVKDMPYRMLDEAAIVFGCTCSEERVLGGLATAGREEIESMIAEAKDIEAQCGYCNKEYKIPVDRLQGLLLTMP